MNITKKQWTIIGVVVAIILVWYFFLRKKETENSFAISRGRVGISRGTGIVNIAEPGSLCCCKADTDKKGYCKNPSKACCLELVAGEPMPTPGGVA